MKKKYLEFSGSILIVLVLTITLVVSYNNSKADKGVDEYQSIFKQKLPKGIVSEKLYDSYGGFHNEGQRLYKLSFSKENADIFISEIDSSSSWNKLPLSQPLSLIMFGGSINDKKYNYQFATKVGLPEVKNGYWQFINENAEEDILSSFSYRFSLAIFDRDSNIMYLYKIHT